MAIPKGGFCGFKDWSSSMMTYLEELAKEHGASRPIKRWQERLVIKLRQKTTSAGFSSDPDYAKHLISIIETYHL